MSGLPRRLSERREGSLLFALKLASLVTNILYQFVLIAALVRTLGQDLYPTVVLLIAIGNYVLNSDIGFASYVFSKLRRDYVMEAGDRDLTFIGASFSVYLYITLLAILVMGLYLFWWLDQDVLTTSSIAVFFAVVVLSLPWRLVQKIATALDFYLMIEVVEVVRRSLVLILAAAMLAGLPFWLFAALSLVVWIGAYGVALARLRVRGIGLQLAGGIEAGRFIYRQRAHILETGGFTGLEFIIYNFPYLAIPALSLGPGALVLFDLFYKVTRFGGIAYKAPAETLLPYQTRAYHEGRTSKVAKIFGWMILLDLAVFLGTAVFLAWFGIAFFDVLIDGIVPIEDDLIYLMIAMLCVSTLQVPATIFLSSIGAFRLLQKVSALGLATVSVSIAVTYWFDLGFIDFLAWYWGGYAVFTIIYQVAMVAVLRREPAP